MSADYHNCRRCFTPTPNAGDCDVCEADALMARLLSVRIAPRRGVGFEARRLTARARR